MQTFFCLELMTLSSFDPESGLLSAINDDLEYDLLEYFVIQPNSVSLAAFLCQTSTSRTLQLSWPSLIDSGLGISFLCLKLVMVRCSAPLDSFYVFMGTILVFRASFGPLMIVHY